MKPGWMYVVAAVLVGTFAFALWPRAPHRDDHLEAGTVGLEPLFAAPAFSFADQHGKAVSNQSLRGKVWVANFIFTTCRTVCPLLTVKLGQLQRRLEGVDARFVSFSVDPERDTPEALAKYAQYWRPNEPRWSLLATTAQTLPPLVQGFKVVAQKTDAGDAVDPILHSTVFLLIDAEGQVRGAYDSEVPEQLARLERGVRTLVGSTGDAPALAKSGEQLYLQLGCAGCHDKAELAPSLAGLSGQRRTFDSGLTAVADLAYVRESIVAPQAKRVAGYPLAMPSYAGLIDRVALETLSAHVLAFPPAPVTPPEDAQVAKDPVCGMQVRVTPSTPRAERDGKPVWFCSEACRDRFNAKP
jgi:cytochrome oxidase Cu insertion factor (SCO1/SenC/PrrC family)/YHS domain-containing protein